MYGLPDAFGVGNDEGRSESLFRVIPDAVRVWGSMDPGSTLTLGRERVFDLKDRKRERAPAAKRSEDAKINHGPGRDPGSRS